MPEFDMPPASAGFPARGRWLIDRLAAELELTEAQAAGIVGNIGFESGGLEKLHEIGQPDGRGGYGWAQWTGDRRVAFLDWAQAQGLAWQSDEANYGYLLVELRGAYRHTVEALRQTATVEQAVWSVGQTYERPGGTTSTHLPGYADRLARAREALSGPRTAPKAPGAITVADSPVPAPSAAPYAATIPDLVRMLQMKLNEAGADPQLVVDGIPGPRTQAALLRWNVGR